jgi:hypothetical protein
LYSEETERDKQKQHLADLEQDELMPDAAQSDEAEDWPDDLNLEEGEVDPQLQPPHWSLEFQAFPVTPSL